MLFIIESWQQNRYTNDAPSPIAVSSNFERVNASEVLTNEAVLVVNPTESCRR